MANQAPVSVGESWRSLYEAETPADFFSAWLNSFLAQIQSELSTEQAILVWADCPNTGPFRPVAQNPQGGVPDPVLADLCEQVLELRLPVQRALPGTTTFLWGFPLLLKEDIWGDTGPESEWSGFFPSARCFALGDGLAR